MPISTIHKAIIDAYEGLGDFEEIYIRKAGRGTQAKVIIKKEQTIIIEGRLIDNKPE